MKKKKQPPTTTMKVRRVCVREWLARRHKFGHCDLLLTELQKEGRRDYGNYLRITPDLFQEMSEKLTPPVKKQTTFTREPIDVELPPFAS